MKAPVLAFRNPKPPRQQTPEIARKAALLAEVKPHVAEVIERQITRWLVDAGVRPREWRAR